MKLTKKKFLIKYIRQYVNRNITNIEKVTILGDTVTIDYSTKNDFKNATILMVDLKYFYDELKE